MKTKFLMLLLGMLICCLSLRAQVCIRLVSDPSKGACVGDKLTKAMAKTQFGQPKAVDSFYDDECYNAPFDEINYDHMVLRCVDYKLESFGTSSNKYFIEIHKKFRIKVGDNVDDFVKSLPVSEHRMQTYSDAIIVYFKIQGTNVFGDSSLMITIDKNRIVTAISWYSPI